MNTENPLNEDNAPELEIEFEENDDELGERQADACSFDGCTECE